MRSSTLKIFGNTLPETVLKPPTAGSLNSSTPSMHWGACPIWATSEKIGHIIRYDSGPSAHISLFIGLTAARTDRRGNPGLSRYFVIPASARPLIRFSIPDPTAPPQTPPPIPRALYPAPLATPPAAARGVFLITALACVLPQQPPAAAR